MILAPAVSNLGHRSSQLIDGATRALDPMKWNPENGSTEKSIIFNWSNLVIKKWEGN